MGESKRQNRKRAAPLPFAAAYMFRPGFIEPANGEVSRTKLYRIRFTSSLNRSSP